MQNLRLASLHDERSIFAKYGMHASTLARLYLARLVPAHMQW